jgi:hypothetical protein
MSTSGPSQDERTARLRLGVRELADAVPVPDIKAADLRAAAARRRPRPGPVARRLPVLAAAATVLVVAAVGLLPAVLPGREAQPGAALDNAVLPKRFADHSRLTAHVSDSPPGRAVALYAYGTGDLLTQTPQVIVVAADGRNYRQLDAADWPSTASTLLSPDGSKVALGGTGDAIAVVDLITGDTRRYPMDGGAQRFLAWSPDSSRLLYLRLPGPPDMLDEPRDAEPFVLDMGSGVRTAIPGQRGTVDAAIAPDGSRLALQGHGQLRIVRWDGTVERTVPVPDRHRLAGAAAWSPDGSRLALYRMGESGVPGTPAPVYTLPKGGFPGGLSVVDLASGAMAEVDTPDRPRALLGWRGDRLLVDYWGETIVQTPVGGGPYEFLCTLQPGNDHLILDLQLATALLPAVEVRDAGVDRGPWPAWLRLAVTAGALLAGGLVLLLIRAFRRRPPAGWWS